MLLSGWLSTLMGHSRDWDFLNYHFYDGWAFLHHRFNIDAEPARIWNFFNPLLDAFNDLIICATGNNLMMSTFILGMISGIGVFIFYLTIALIFDQTHPHRNFYITLAFLIGITAPTALSQIGATTNDFQTASIIVLGIYFALSALIQEKNKKLLLLTSGLLTGVAMGLKLTNMLYAGSLELAIFFSVTGTKNKIHFSLFLCVGILLGFLMTNGWWMLFLYQHFKSPFFPFYNKIFHSPYYPLDNYNDTRFSIHHLTQIFTRPFEYMRENRLAHEVTTRDWRLGTLLLLTALYFLELLFLPKRNSPTKPQTSTLIKFLIIYVWSSYLIWVVQFGISRYAIPTELMSGALIILLWAQIFKEGIIGKGILGGLTALIILSTIPPISIEIYPSNEKFVYMDSPGQIPKNSLIILNGFKQSFVIPFFPTSTVFVSTTFDWGGQSKNNMTSIFGIQKIRQHQGPIFILFGHGYQDSPGYPVKDLKLNGLEFSLDIRSCKALKTNQHFESAFYLCPAIQKTT